VVDRPPAAPMGIGVAERPPALSDPEITLGRPLENRSPNHPSLSSGDRSTHHRKEDECPPKNLSRQEIRERIQLLQTHANVSPDARLICATIEAAALDITEALDGVGERISYMIDQAR
jgi:hypothetical protein